MASGNFNEVLCWRFFTLPFISGSRSTIKQLSSSKFTSFLSAALKFFFPKISNSVITDNPAFPLIQMSGNEIIAIEKVYKRIGVRYYSNPTHSVYVSGRSEHLRPTLLYPDAFSRGSLWWAFAYAIFCQPAAG